MRDFFRQSQTTFLLGIHKTTKKIDKRFFWLHQVHYIVRWVLQLSKSVIGEIEISSQKGVISLL